MHPQFPDYPVDQAFGEIPESQCCDILCIWPEHGRAYLWDMNGCAISLEDVLGAVDWESLDDELPAWQELYEGVSIDYDVESHNFDLIWSSEEQSEKIYKDGESLARKVYEFFNRTRTVICLPSWVNCVRLNAEGKPPIRCKWL